MLFAGYGIFACYDRFRLPDAADQPDLLYEGGTSITNISGYFYSIAVCAVILSLLEALLEGRGGASKIGKLLCGIFLLLTMVRPLMDATWPAPQDFLPDTSAEISSAVEEGQALAQNHFRDSITQRLEAYILDKAAMYDASLSVTVTLSEDAIPVPVGVLLKGTISPYGKRQIKRILADELGIPEEAQVWI